MGGSRAGEEVRLLEALKEAGGDRVRLVAVLWTWVDAHLVELGQLEEKPPAIFTRALRAPAFEKVGDRDMHEILESPISYPAELLARVGLSMVQVKVPLFERSRGFRGEKVVVALSASELIKRMGGDDYPPSAQEHPSVTTLAPNLIVSPVMEGQIEINSLKPTGPVWQAALQRMRKGLSGNPARLEIHLDTLGHHGMTGWRVDGEREVGSFDSTEIDAEDEQHCIDAAQEAVRLAAGESSLLVLPELAATPPVVKALQAELAAQDDPPALTVVGMYHEEVDEPPRSPLLAGERVSSWVNEAVVLGPNGSELWRHRKLTCAEGKLSKEREHVVEDIRPGENLVIVPTPLGNLAVLICLDAFADHARSRLARSPANVLLIPSLSPKVLRHRASLQHLVQLIWGVAFVCNRAPRFDAAANGSVWNETDNRSFWALQREEVHVFDEKHDSEHHSFVFQLGDLEGTQMKEGASSQADEMGPS